MDRTNLKSFFNPRSVAVIGASAKPGKVGNDIVVNLKNSFAGKIYPINLDEKNIAGLSAYPSIAKVPGPVDLAIIVIPAQFVAEAVEECGKKKCQNIVIISAGFRELGEAGVALENEIKKIAGKYQIRILGPNCLGFISALLPVNASFAPGTPTRGNVAFLSQSGALGTAFLDLAEAQKVGLAYFVSMGNKLDIDENDLLEYCGSDDKVKVIISYLEDIRAGRRFMETASRVSRQKPVVVLKAGKTEKGSQAVSSHTGSLAGSAQAYSTAFAQSGLIEARDLEDFFNLAKGFSWQALPKGKRVAIITNAGGPGVLLTDLLSTHGLELAELSASAAKKIKSKLPPAASVKNPIDVLGDAGADRYEWALGEALKDKNVDAVIVALTPQKMTDVAKTAEIVGRLAKKTTKTVLACFMGEAKITGHYDIFQKYSLPVYNFPNQAVETLGRMWQYSRMRMAPLTIAKSKIKPSENKIFNQAVLTEIDARKLLLPLGFNLHRAEFAADGKAAIGAAEKIGWPVAIKIVSEKITHKSDVGGVKLNIKNTEEMTAAIAEMKKKIPALDGFLVGEMVKGFEVIVGMKRDAQFGPLVMVGAGGIYAEIFKDVAFRIAPFDKAAARAMIGDLKIAKMFAGARGQKPLDIEAVAEILVKTGDFAQRYPQVKEMDFNPVMVGVKGKGAKIVDVRMSS